MFYYFGSAIIKLKIWNNPSIIPYFFVTVITAIWYEVHYSLIYYKSENGVESYLPIAIFFMTFVYFFLSYFFFHLRSFCFLQKRLSYQKSTYKKAKWYTWRVKTHTQKRPMETSALLCEKFAEKKTLIKSN